MEEVKQMIENYELGFISPADFLRQYMAFLQFFGAHKCLEDKINELLSELATSLCQNLKQHNKNNNMIENFGTAVFSIQAD